MSGGETSMKRRAVPRILVLVQHKRAELAWGSNGDGQLGDGTTTDRPTPVLTDAPGLQVVAMGQRHAIGARLDGTVSTWGSNDSGQLGTGTSQQHVPTPALVSGVGNVVAVAAGRSSSYALKRTGELFGWGSGGWGELGTATPTWQAAVPAQIPGMTDVRAIASGDDFVAAVKRDGSLWAWGFNVSDEAGSRGASPQQNTPVQVGCTREAVAVAAGSFHALALASDGTVTAWGQNESGELGDGTLTNRGLPVAVSGLPPAKALAAGAYSSLALARDGTVWGWGDNGFGELGLGPAPLWTTVPLQLPGLSNVIAIACGDFHALAVSQDGNVWTWGGQAPTAPKTPTRVQGVAGGRVVAGGLESSVVIVEAQAQVQPRTLDFGTVAVGSSAVLQATLSNAGSLPLTVDSIDIAGDLVGGPDFTASSGCVGTLAAGASCTIDVTFAPSAAGAQQESIQVRTDGGWPTATLRGVGA